MFEKKNLLDEIESRQQNILMRKLLENDVECIVSQFCS